MRTIPALALIGAMTLAACVGTTEAGARGDGSIDAAEHTKGAFGQAAPVDASYDAVEQTRAHLVLESSATSRPQGTPTGARAVPQ